MQTKLQRSEGNLDIGLNNNEIKALFHSVKHCSFRLFKHSFDLKNTQHKYTKSCLY